MYYVFLHRGNCLWISVYLLFTCIHGFLQYMSSRAVTSQRAPSNWDLTLGFRNRSVEVQLFIWFLGKIRSEHLFWPGIYDIYVYIYFFLLDVYTFWEDCSIYTFRQNVSRWWFKHCFFQPKPWVNGPNCLSNRCCGWTSEPFSWPRSFVHVGNYDTKMVGKNIASNFRVNQGTVGCTPDRVQCTHYIIFIYIYVYL